MSGFIPEPYRDFYRAAIRQGWEVTTTGSGHLKWTNPVTGRSVFTPGTPGKSRGAGHLQIQRKLERNGLVLTQGRGRKS